VRHLASLVLLLAVLAGLGFSTAGCGVDAWYFQSITSGAGGGSTLVLVWLSDSPVDGASHLWITLERVEWVGATQTTLLLTGPQQVDLLALQAGVRADIGRGEVPVEDARLLRLTLTPDGAGRHRIRVGGVDHELWLESPSRQVLELPITTTLVKDATLEVQVDVNARLSAVESGGTWFLRPSGQAFDLARAGFVAGRATDPGLVPLAGAVVSAQQGGQEIASTRTNVSGQFKLGPLTPGAYHLVASLAGHEPTGAGPLYVGAGATLPGVDLVLGGTGSGALGGSVGSPALGQVVRLYGPLGFLAQAGVDPVSGAYALPQVAPGTYTLELWGSAGLLATRSGLVVTPGGTLAVDF
jgi:hypothetical protein